MGLRECDLNSARYIERHFALEEKRNPRVDHPESRARVGHRWRIGLVNVWVPETRFAARPRFPLSAEVPREKGNLHNSACGLSHCL